MKQSLTAAKTIELRTHFIEQVIALARKVYQEIGLGLLENTYKHWLGFELSKEDIPYEMDVPLPTPEEKKKNHIDLLINHQIVVLIKSEETLTILDEVQLRAYLDKSGKTDGLIINFSSPDFTEGVKHISLEKKESPGHVC